MTSNELRRKFNTAWRIIRAERTWRERVFPPGHDLRDQKLAEMDTLLLIITELKDELKERLAEEEYQQPRLLDAPRKAGYE